MAISTSNALTAVAESTAIHPFRIKASRENIDERRRRGLASARQPTAVLVPVPDDPRPGRAWVVAAFLLGAIARADRPAAPPRTRARHLQALTHGETRVLRYLPTNLSAREIADELYMSVNTVKTHQRHLYQKLGAHSRTQAVGQARALGLLASSGKGLSTSVALAGEAITRFGESDMKWSRCRADHN